MTTYPGSLEGWALRPHRRWRRRICCRRLRHGRHVIRLYAREQARLWEIILWVGAQRVDRLGPLRSVPHSTADVRGGERGAVQDLNQCSGLLQRNAGERIGHSGWRRQRGRCRCGCSGCRRQRGRCRCGGSGCRRQRGGCHRLSDRRALRRRPGGSDGLRAVGGRRRHGRRRCAGLALLDLSRDGSPGRDRNRCRQHRSHCGCRLLRRRPLDRQPLRQGCGGGGCCKCGRACRLFAVRWVL